MKDPSGNWNATPPSYEVIAAEGRSSYLLVSFIFVFSIIAISSKITR